LGKPQKPTRDKKTIAKNLNLPGIIQHLSLEKYRNSYLLVLEYAGGISLSDFSEMFIYEIAVEYM
jgi:predicted small secreted protein